MSCIFCAEHSADRDVRMLPVMELPSGRLFLFRDQTLRGHCVLSFRSHKNELFDLDQSEQEALLHDICAVSRVLRNEFHCYKVNIGIYGDGIAHLHVHIVPKYPDKPDFGSSFTIIRPQPVYLKKEDYQEIIQALYEGLKKQVQT